MHALLKYQRKSRGDYFCVHPVDLPESLHNRNEQQGECGHHVLMNATETARKYFSNIYCYDICKNTACEKSDVAELYVHIILCSRDWSPGAVTKKRKIRSNGVGKGSRDLLLKFWDPLHISGMVWGRNFKFVYWSPGVLTKNEKLGQRVSGRSHVTYFWNFGTLSISRERFEMETSNLPCRLTTRGTNDNDSDMPIHYTTFMGLRWRLMVVYSRASPLLRPFWREIF